ncbi:glycerol-3-phosphate transporter ATP-binding subunit [compost metagenome]
MGDLTLTGTISLVEYLGSELFIYLRLTTGQTVLVKAPGKSSHQTGETLTVSLRADDAHYFDNQGQRLAQPGEPAL